MGKRIFFVAIALFLAFQTWNLLSASLLKEPALSAGEALFIAFLINLYVTGVFAFPGFVFSTYKLLPAGYYTLGNPAILKKWYTILGIKYFAYLLLLAYWGKAKNKQRFFNGTRSGLSQLTTETKRAEFGHAGAFIVIAVCCIPLAFQGYFKLTLMCMAINIIGNLYPVILQRSHRMRIMQILN